ncbi:hypothetical protein BY458DRAFT_492057 [Sporodiniella umbellata]|nr:hypothetical protein BY458DRAFT_492057 [Sporodiniella umbellata]
MESLTANVSFGKFNIQRGQRIRIDNQSPSYDPQPNILLHAKKLMFRCCIITQRRILYPTGCCKVKVSYAESTTVSIHQDLLKLSIFGKDTTNDEDVENVILLQAVGKFSTGYLPLRSFSISFMSY